MHVNIENGYIYIYIYLQCAVMYPKSDGDGGK